MFSSFGGEHHSSDEDIFDVSDEDIINELKELNEITEGLESTSFVSECLNARDENVPRGEIFPVIPDVPTTSEGGNNAGVEPVVITEEIFPYKEVQKEEIQLTRGIDKITLHIGKAPVSGSGKKMLQISVDMNALKEKVQASSPSIPPIPSSNTTNYFFPSGPAAAPVSAYPSQNTLQFSGETGPFNVTYKNGATSDTPTIVTISKSSES